LEISFQSKVLFSDVDCSRNGFRLRIHYKSELEILYRISGAKMPIATNYSIATIRNLIRWSMSQPSLLIGLHQPIRSDPLLMKSVSSNRLESYLKRKGTFVPTELCLYSVSNDSKLIIYRNQLHKMSELLRSQSSHFQMVLKTDFEEIVADCSNWMQLMLETHSKDSLCELLVNYMKKDSIFLHLERRNNMNLLFWIET
jgi:hypothetical protein